MTTNQINQVVGTKINCYLLYKFLFQNDKTFQKEITERIQDNDEIEDKNLLHKILDDLYKGKTKFTGQEKEISEIINDSIDEMINVNIPNLQIFRFPHDYETNDVVIGTLVNKINLSPDIDQSISIDDITKWISQFKIVDENLKKINWLDKDLIIKLHNIHDDCFCCS